MLNFFSVTPLLASHTIFLAVRGVGDAETGQRPNVIMTNLYRKSIAQ